MLDLMVDCRADIEECIDEFCGVKGWDLMGSVLKTELYGLG